MNIDIAGMCSVVVYVNAMLTFGMEQLNLCLGVVLEDCLDVL